jgi:molybdopterin/thiamine biosynthesis adenylyltransferase
MARQRQGAQERHACQVAANLIKAGIGERAKAASFMTQEFNVRRQRQQAGHPARQTDIRITRAQVLACTTQASNEDIVVRQERRDQITHSFSGEVSSVMYGAKFRVSPKTRLVEHWQEIAE